MKKILVWDLPVRLFHWALTFAFFGAFGIALLVDDERSLFAVHMLLGATMAFMVLLRFFWGFAGTRWSRFRSFAVRPKEVLSYVVGVFTGRDRRYAGHTPGSSVAAILMFVIVLGLASTGIMMASGRGEALEGIHELLAWSMAAVVLVHLAGIAWHTLRHRENIAFSMVSGRKEADPADAIRSARPFPALAFVLLTLLFVGGLMSGYDAPRGRVTIPLTGQTLQVVENHGHGGDANGREHSEDEHDD